MSLKRPLNKLPLAKSAVLEKIAGKNGMMPTELENQENMANSIPEMPSLNKSPWMSMKKPKIAP